MTVKTQYQPITKSLTVPRGQAETFAFYTERLDSWWPKRSHSVGQEKVVRVTLEPQAGGRIYEVQEDGTEVAWGWVRVWDAPRRVVHSWHPGRDEEQATEVEITFTALSAKATRVDLVHRHWERLGEGAESLHGHYDGGWDFVLGECFRGFALA